MLQVSSDGSDDKTLDKAFSAECSRELKTVHSQQLQRKQSLKESFGDFCDFVPV